MNAETSREIVFTRGATEAINLVAQTWGLDNIKEGDEIVTTVMEHHSNMVPWQVCYLWGAGSPHVTWFYGCRGRLSRCGVQRSSTCTTPAIVHFTG